MTAIRVRDLTKVYGEVRAVDGVDLDVADGEFVGVLGPNGAGKTTLLEVVEGLRRPDSGTVEVLGEQVQCARGPGGEGGAQLGERGEVVVGSGAPRQQQRE